MLRSRRPVILSVGLLLLCVWMAGAPSAGGEAAHPTLVGTLRLSGRTTAVSASGDVGLVVTEEPEPGSSGWTIVSLRAVSLANPDSPAQLGSVELARLFGTPGKSRIRAVANWVLVACDEKTYCVDVTDRANPRLASLAELPGTVTAGASPGLWTRGAPSGEWIFSSWGSREVRLYSADGRGPLASYTTPGTAEDVLVLGDLLFVADGPTSGLVVLRLAMSPFAAGGSPSASPIPQLIARASLDTPGAARAIAVCGGLVLIADGTDGLTVVGGPLPPGSVAAVVDTPGDALDVAVSRDLALVADGAEGLQVIELPVSPGPATREEALSGRVDEIRTAGPSPNIALAESSWEVSFILPWGAGLSGTAGDTLTATFPAGTSLAATKVALNGAPIPASSVAIADSRAVIALPEGFLLPGGGRVALTLDGCRNPPADNNLSVSVSTSSCLVPARSNPFGVAAADTRVGGVLVTSVSPDTAGLPASYSLLFTVPAGGALSSSRGDQITVTFPRGALLSPLLGVTLNGVGLLPIIDFTVWGNDVVASVPTGVDLPAGSQVNLEVTACVNPPRGASYMLSVSTTACPDPAFSSPFSIADAGIPGQIQDLRVTNVAPNVEGLSPEGASYGLSFLIPAGGDLEAGDTISVAFPFGFSFDRGVGVGLNGDVLAPTSYAIGAGNDEIVITLAKGQKLPALGRIDLLFTKCTNPPRGANYVVRVSTSKSPLPALSDPFAILGSGSPRQVQDLRVVVVARNVEGAPPHTVAYGLSFVIPFGGALAKGDTISVYFPLGFSFNPGTGVSLNGKTLAPASYLIGAANDEIVITLGPDDELPPFSRVDLFFTRCTNPPRGTNYVVRVSTSKSPNVALSDTFAIADDLGGAAKEILAGLEKKIELETSILSILEALRSCIGTLSLNGTVTPPVQSRNPIDIVISIDSSSSMDGNDKPRLALSGAKALIDQLDPTKDRVGIVSWDGQVQLAQALGSDFSAAKAILDRVQYQDSTCYDCGLREPLNLFNQAGQSGARRVVVFLTDGEASSYAPPGSSGSLVDQLAAAGIVIYAVGLGAAPDMTLLGQMAAATGGEALAAKQASDLAGVFSAIAQKLMNPWQVHLSGSCQ